MSEEEKELIENSYILVVCSKCKEKLFIQVSLDEYTCPNCNNEGFDMDYERRTEIIEQLKREE